MDVPLQNQTRECLIALIGSMDKQAKDNEKRRAALEKVPKTAKSFLCRIYDAYNDSNRGGELRQFPGHDHEKWAIWDSDNGDKAGKPCKDCESMIDLHNALEPFWNSIALTPAPRDKEPK